MAKKKSKTISPELKLFLKDIEVLSSLPVSGKYQELRLGEYPFDGQLLEMSELYRASRRLYYQGGGKFSAKVCSVARSLSAQDLFEGSIDYSPIQDEILWFEQGYREVANPSEIMTTLLDYNGVSLFHEQNHRIVWQNLPPAPTEKIELCRYLNFAESLVVALDLALADEVGKKLSPSFEHLKTIYRTGGEDSWFSKSKSEYRNYLYAVMTATYFLLELYSPKDIPKGLAHVFPDDKKIVKDAVKRSLDLSELFTQQTNQLWQERYWEYAEDRLAEMHAKSTAEIFYMPEEALDFGETEFAIAGTIFEKFNL